MVRRHKKTFNKLTFIAAIVAILLLPTLYFYLKNPRFVKAAPWAQSAGNWISRKQISLVNNSGATLHSNTTYTITFDTKSLYDQGFLKANCDDLRVFYQPSDTNAVDLYRHTLPPNGYTCATSGSTKISFPLQADISNSATDSNYYIYYNNSSATAYSDSDALKAYDVGAKTATFVAPFNGSTTALAAGSGTPTTETGAIRYSGSKSALSFDGAGDYVDAGNVGTGVKTVELWVYPNSTTNYLIDLNGSAYISVSSGTISATGFTDPTIYVNGAASSTLAANSWQHVAVVTGTAIDASAVYLGKISSNYFSGRIDELRLSSIGRYTVAFTAPGAPFVRDEFTKLLLHFDENGDDPRNSGKAIDDSENAKHGTITGAKYVGGLVGVDSSTSETGYSALQSYSSHEGIFIEEGTTNKITNPSFEHATYNTNWTNGGNSFDVFTPGNKTLSLRNAPGPFTAAPIVQGDPVNGDSLTDDILSFSREKQIGGNFYSNFDTNQGSVVLWWTPEFAYNSLSGSGLHYLWYVNSSFYLAYDYANDRYQLGIGGQSMTVSSEIAAGTAYGLVSRWDTKATIDGSNYAAFSINDSTTYGITSQPTVSAPANNIYIGSDGSTGGSSGIIEGLIVYRRVLYDGTYGINANAGTDEVAVVKLSSGSDPTLITGSWDIVFAMPTNSTVGSLVSSTGHVWSHPYSSNLLPGNSNLGGLMLNGTYSNDGWGDEGSPTNVEALAASEKIFSGGYKITSDAANEGIYDEISVTSGQDFVVRAIAHSDGTSIPKVVITGADDAAIATFSGTTSSTRASPDLLFFTFEADATENIKVKLINSDSTSGHITYWHQVEILASTINNPSMERVTGTPDPWIPDGWTNYSSGIDAGDTSQETSIVHSGSKSIRFNSGATSSELLFSDTAFSSTNGSFNMLGGFVYGNGTTGVLISSTGSTAECLETGGTSASFSRTATASWVHKSGIFWKNSANANRQGQFTGNSASNIYLDDIYALRLNDSITLFLNPSSQINSTETNGLRIDGRDTAIQNISSLTTTSGTIKFKYNPRHSAADVFKFYEATDTYIAEFVGSGNDYIRVYWSAANTITLAYNMNGTASSTTWAATGAIVAGTTYEFQIDYTGSSTMTLKVDSSTKITLSSIPAGFGTAPYLAFWGSRKEGDRQGDALFSAAASSSTYDATSLVFTPANPSLNKRNGSASGPFAAGVLFQGDQANANSLTDDLLSFNREKQIYGNFYSNLDTNQGSVVLWWTPEYAYNSLSGSGLHYLWYINSDYYLAYDYANDRFEQKVGGQSITSSSNVSAGTGYSLITTWDTKNVLSGSNYQCLIIDNGTPTCGTSKPTVSEPATSIYIGSNGTTGSASGIIEGLTIYRRPLYDGANGIDVGNGDEVNSIAGATDTDSSYITGSWDVVLALRTNGSTGSLVTGTNEAWSHPHSSNVLYTSSTNTGGFMMNGTYTSDGWADEGTPASVSALYTEEKIYSGGYLVTSDAANEGIKYSKSSLTAGQNYVIRGLAHSDGTAVPAIQVFDSTNSVPIATVSGASTSTRVAPSMINFAFELPTTARNGSASNCTAVDIKLLNTASSGTIYWHQVELLTNMIDNPSLDVGTVTSGNYVPSGWTASATLASGESMQDISDYHSGTASAHLVSNLSTWSWTSISISFSLLAPGNFLSYGGWTKESASAANMYGAFGESISPYNRYSFATTSSWDLGYRVINTHATSSVTYTFEFETQFKKFDFYADDVYSFYPTNVLLFVAPAVSSNSVESEKIRIDGLDTYANTLSTLATTSGTITFDYTPRHSAADVAKFGNTTPYIAKFLGNTNDYISLYWSAANTITLAYSMAGTTGSTTWSATGAITAGTTYRMVISYTGSGNMTFSVDGSTKITLSSIPAAFNTAPATAFWGSNSDGTYQNDAYFVPEFVAPTENTTAPYYKFGSKSAKLDNTTAGDGRGYVISINPGNTNTQMLSAYVYDGTSGNIGGTVSSTIAKLVFNGSVVTPSAYTDMGGGWWRLTYSAAGVNSSGNYGVSVLSGKTVYIDGIQLEEKAYATTYTDGTLGDSGEYDWTGTANNSTSSRTAENLQYASSSNLTAATGSFSFWLKSQEAIGSVSSDQYLFDIRSDDSNRLAVYLDASEDDLTLNTNGTETSSTGITLSSGTWTNFVLTWDFTNDQYKLYQNGSGTPIISTTTSLNAPSLPTNFVVGGNYNNESKFNGLISEARVFSSVLSSAEVADLYYTGLGAHKEGNGIEQFTDGEPPISVWHLDENTGTTINDSMSANHGTLASGDSTPTWVTGTDCIRHSCLQFDGTNDYGSITNNISGIKSLSFWVKPTVETTSVFSLNGTQTVTITNNVIAANNFTSPTIYVNSIQTTTVPTDTWSQVVITTSTPIGASGFSFGKVSTSYFTGYLDEIRIFPYVISATQVNKEVNVGSAAIIGQGIGAAQVTPIKSKLVAHWKLDEGFGTVAHDSIGSNDGTFGASTAAPNWDNNGKIGKALRFDGSNDYVDLGTKTAYDLTTYSISGWFKTSNKSDYKGVVVKNISATNRNWWISVWKAGAGTHPDGSLVFRTSSGGVANVDIDSGKDVADGKWHHFVAVLNGTTEAKLYLDGSLKATQSSPGVPDTPSTPLIIGNGIELAGRFFEGSIDDVKIYNSALSEDEVRQDYNYGSSVKFGDFSNTSGLTGGSVASSSASAAYCIPGDTATCSPPVAEWLMEEGKDQTVNDSSGNGASATLGANSSVGSDDPSWISGKIGKALSFDGSNDKVAYGSTLFQSNFSVSFWFKPSGLPSSNSYIFSEGASYSPATYITLYSDGDLDFRIFATAIATDSRPISSGNWYHLEGTFDGTNGTLYINGVQAKQVSASMGGSPDRFALGVGTDGTKFFSGSIDNFRVFNYARTPAQIAWDYNRGKALVHYKFEECSGTTIHSSNDPYNPSYDATLTIGASGNQTAAGTCGTDGTAWENGSSGKYYSSLNFDGTDDYVGLSGSLSYIKTLGFWAKPSTTTQKIMELSASDSVEISSGVVTVTGFGTETVYVDGVATTLFPDTNWHQVTIVSSTDITANTVNIGKVSTSYYSGQIDDVRIFNYGLTSVQVGQLFNEGGGIRFSSGE